MSIAIELSDEELQDAREKAQHWALTNGLVLLSKERISQAEHLPFTLLPSPYSHAHFNLAMDLQPSVNTLIYNLSTSEKVLETIFTEHLIHVDDFLSKLWSIYKIGLKDGFNQQIRLIVLRTDYMLDKKPQIQTINKTKQQNGYESIQYALKQVEINSMAAGFGFVGGCIAKLHKEVLKWTKLNKILNKLPEPDNNPLDSISKAFVSAWNLYNSKQAVILFIVLNKERNISDQRHLEYAIRNKGPNIDVVRCTLASLFTDGCLTENRVLCYKGKEVALVYFRAGYSPQHYETSKEWQALTMIECSKAIKTPSIGEFLAGMKCVQEYICDPKNLYNICPNQSIDANEQLLSVFGKFFKLDNKKNIEDALRNPQNYVLKPQREGGSNNYYDSKIVDILENSDNLQEYDRRRFVLMERYRPMVSENYLIRANSNENFPTKEKLTNELGVFGVLLSDEQKVYLNETSGYCLRSKPCNDYECGVMSGSGAVDSIYFAN